MVPINSYEECEAKQNYKSMNWHIIEIRVCKESGLCWNQFDVDHFVLYKVQKNCMIYNNSSNRDASKTLTGIIRLYITGTGLNII